MSNCGAEGSVGCVCGRCEDPHDWLVLGPKPWDHGVATWWDYDWRKLAAGYPDRSAPRQVFTRIAEAIEGKSPARLDASSDLGAVNP